MKYLLLLSLISLQSVFAIDYSCITDDGLTLEVTEVQIAEKTYVDLHLIERKTKISVPMDWPGADSINDKDQYYLYDFDEAWIPGTFPGTKRYVMDELKFEFNKNTKVGSYYKGYKRGFFSRTNIEKFTFECD